MKRLVSLLIVAFGLAGCGTIQSESNLPSGTILGWNNHLYRIEQSIRSNQVGKELGKVSYHGKVSGAFTVYELIGVSPTRSIVFGAASGQYYEADAQTSR